MARVLVPIHVVSLVFFLLSLTGNSEEEEVKLALVQLIGELSPMKIGPSFGWNMSSDPCTDKWQGVSCDSKLQSVRKIVLDRFNLTGVLNATSLCKAKSLFVLSLNDNNVGGEIQQEISNCRYLTHLYLSGNRFSGNLPVSISQLSNLKRFDISNNDFSKQIPDMSRISGLLSFLAQNNHLSGEIPKFDFSNLQEFNVSNNNLSGPIPDVFGHFNASSFSGNLELCGQPWSNPCPMSTPPPPKEESKRSSKKEFLIYSGFFVAGLIVAVIIAVKFLKKNLPKGEKTNVKKEVVDSKTDKSSGTSSEFKNRSEYSITSGESGKGSSSLVVLASAVMNGLKFEDLLQSPAELVGRGKNGSLYKVIVDDGVTLAVKRIKDWGMTRADFEKRMERIDQVKHPNVMPVVAYYCSKQEKLLVYEFQHNGSLFQLLHAFLSQQRNQAHQA